MLESAFQAKLIKEIEEALPGCVIMKNDANYRQGVPDILILFKRRWGMLEVKKSPTANQQPNQKYWVKRLDEMGYSSFVFPENKDAVLRELVGYLNV